MSDEKILDVHDLVTRFYTYDGVVRALEGVSFDIKKGETVGLVGETGCGKSVSALSVLRLIPSPPGRIEGGQILFLMPEAERQKLRAAEDHALPLLRAHWKALALAGNGWLKEFESQIDGRVSNPVSQLPADRIVAIAHAVRKASAHQAAEGGKRTSLPPEASKALLDDFKSIYTARARYDLLAKDEAFMRSIRGNAISMIFQEPMSALNPVIRVGDQIAENILLHQEVALAREALVWLDLELKMMGTKPLMPRADPETLQIVCPTCQAPNHGRPSACNACRTRFVYPAWGVPLTVAAGRKCPFCSAVNEDPNAEACEKCRTPFRPTGRKPGTMEPGLAPMAGLTSNPLRRAKLRFYRSLYLRKALTPKERAARKAAEAKAASARRAPSSAKPPAREPSTPAPVPPKPAATPAATSKIPQRPLTPAKEDVIIRVVSRIPVLRRFRRVMYDRAMRRAVEMLHAVRIPDPEKVIDSYPFELSGGMAQRVLIAIALSCRPQLLIADEPTTALDVTIQAQILKLMRELKQDIGSSVLLITHNLGVVAETCDRVGVMYAGTIVEMASAHEIFKEPLHPYTRGLMESIPSVTVEKDRLAMIHGNVPNLIRPPPGCRFHPRCPLAGSVCQEKVPEIRMLRPEHFVACHMVGGEAHA